MGVAEEIEEAKQAVLDSCGYGGNTAACGRCGQVPGRIAFFSGPGEKELLKSDTGLVCDRCFDRGLIERFGEAAVKRVYLGFLEDAMPFAAWREEWENDEAQEAGGPTKQD